MHHHLPPPATTASSSLSPTHPPARPPTHPTRPPTAELGPLEGILFGKQNNAFHRTNRKKLFRTWGSLTAMLPKGGMPLWGNLSHAPEDVDWDQMEIQMPFLPPTGGEGACLPHLNENDNFVTEGEEDVGGRGSCVTPEEMRRQPIHYGQTIGFTPSPPLASTESVDEDASRPPPPNPTNWTIEELLHHLSTDPDDPPLRRRLAEDYSFDPPPADFGKHNAYMKDARKYWTNPLTVQLPRAPHMRILCLYGVGKATERAYIYRTDANGLPDVIDTSIHDPRRNVSGGVFMAEGDGTVTLGSLGYHCAKLWREPSHNPSGIQVTTRELLHASGGLLSLRGQGDSADHVDIMGNLLMAEDLLKVVSGRDEDEVFGQDRYYSRILEMSAKMPPVSSS